MSISSSTPIIIGVGQYTERLESADYRKLSASDIAAEAARHAFADALSLEQLAESVDAIATTRTFADSSPHYVHPFGKTNNFPHSIAKRLGIRPKHAVWAKVGGNSPQFLINEFFEKVAAGTVGMALIVGGENISSARHLIAKGETADWSETVDGEVENRGAGQKDFKTGYADAHGVEGGPPGYALLENARRARLGMTPAAYAIEMGRLFAPFTRVAAANPYSSSAQKEYSIDELIEPTDRNRMIADPYTQKLCSRDQVNQGAAVLITSVGKARELGVPEEKWVYLHGYSDVRERGLLDREDLGVAPAAQLAARAVIQAAGITVDDISLFDFYSCFPIAVFAVACDGLGLSPEDRRGLTVTGGLPYFGGPGANYSMHAVATMVEKLRENPGSYGFVGANGGYLSKYSAAVYSTTATSFKACDSRALQKQIDGWTVPGIAHEAVGAATIHSYTTIFAKGQPDYSIVVGTLDATGERFFAKTADDDEQTVQEMLSGDPIGKRIFVCHVPRGNRFAFSEERLADLFLPDRSGFQESYECFIVERRGHLLEVTINRPDVLNCMRPAHNDVLETIWDAYEADDTLWVAIVTGAGDKAFSTGNDLKHTAAGNPFWLPKTGFGGLTCRVRSKPVIAAVNGYAMGGGAEMCLAADIVVADENLKFALSEVRVGLISGAGGIVRLPRQIPKKIAMEMILTGRRLGAEEALRLGFISRIAPAGQALQVAREIADEILECSPTSIRLSMGVINEGWEYPSEVGAVKSFSEILHDEMRYSEDLVEGTTAFAQKRKPEWKNR